MQICPSKSVIVVSSQVKDIYGPANQYKLFQCYNEIGGGGGGTTRPLPRDGGAEELRGDPTVGPHPKVWTIDRE